MNARTLPSAIVLPTTLPSSVLTFRGSALIVAVIPTNSPAVTKAHIACVRENIAKSSARYLIRTGGWQAEFQYRMQSRSFRSKQVRDGLAPPNQPSLPALHQHLRWPWPRVVVRSLRHPISSGIEQRDQVACFERLEFAVAGKEVSRLADRPHHSNRSHFPGMRPHRHDLVMCLVERRANEVVHRRIGDDERLLPVLLHLQHTRQQRSSLRHDEAPRLKQQAAFETSKSLVNRRSILMHFDRRAATSAVGCPVVVNPKSPARIDNVEQDACALQLLHQLADALHRRAKWSSGTNLRTNVHAYAMRLKPAASRRAQVDSLRLANVDAEFVLAQAGGNIRMRFREDIRIHAKRKARLHLELARAGRQQFQLAFALHVELKNAGAKRAIDFRSRLSYSRKHNALHCLRRGGMYAFQFAA